MVSRKFACITASALALAIFAAIPASGQTTQTQIPQPDVGELRVAPDSARVDLTMPKFSNPTNVTNPWFPVSKQEAILHVGVVDGKAFRTEVTLLPYKRVVEWNGVKIETLHRLSRWPYPGGGRRPLCPGR